MTDRMPYIYMLVDMEHITATDLRDEAQNWPDVELALVTFLDDSGFAVTQTAQVLYSPIAGRGAMALGGDAVWTDATSIENVIEQFIIGEIRN